MPDWPSSFAGWFALLSTAIAALWALLTFTRNNRIKAAEILLAIERDYAGHIKTLLEIEYPTDYHRRFDSALAKTLARQTDRYTPDERQAMDELDKVLRYFLVCANVRRLSVDVGSLDRLCQHYLRVITSPRRPNLRAYVEQYWPTVYYWSTIAGLPWPRRVQIMWRQLPQRLRSWWHGPPRHADVMHPVESEEKKKGEG